MRQSIQIVYPNRTVLGLAQKDVENNIYPTSEGYVLRNGKRKYL